MSEKMGYNPAAAFHALTVRFCVAGSFEIINFKSSFSSGKSRGIKN